MKKLVLLMILIVGSIFLVGCSQTLDKQKVSCGGWHTGGTVICSCDGKYEKTPCPIGAVCDGATYFCYGNCGKCKCYNGPEDPKYEVPCGETNNFKGIQLGS